MPLVDPLSDIADPEVKQLVDFFNETLGFCPNSVLTMQRRPNIARAFIELNKAVMENHGQLNSEFKRLIAFISSNTAGCRYCQAHTIRAAKRYGASPKRLANIWDFQNQDCFSDAEKAALQFAQEASMAPVNVAKNTEKQLHQFWSDDDIVEIMGVIALFGYLNRWNDVMATSLEDDAKKSGKDLLQNIFWNPGKHN
ncbi:MAG: carboxymuconolactone decarboxylase family protein [Proteobacteria bacterium]|nr:carboxymuconolactone decarboxylase family protein [Pseudomonadota bacterium]